MPGALHDSEDEDGRRSRFGEENQELGFAYLKCEKPVGHPEACWIYV